MNDVRQRKRETREKERQRERNNWDFLNAEDKIDY